MKGEPNMKKTLKVLFAACLTLVMAICVTGYASAEDAIADADFNDGKMHWNISADHVLTISGTGNMPDYKETVNAPWYSYRSQINSIVVEDGVTGLGSYAFYQLTGAASVSLPDSLETMGGYCFYGCSALKTIAVPEGVSAIPVYAFAECSALESIDLPDSVRTFGDCAFCGCRSLKSIVIPEGVENLAASGMLSYCSSLKSITLPSTITKIGADWMFNGTSITDIYFNGTLAQWLNISFNGSSDRSPFPMAKPCNLYIQGEKLSNLTIPDDVTSIPAYAFRYVNLNSVTLSYRVKKIGANAFYGSSVASVRMYDSVTNVGTNAFANCGGLRKVFFIGDQSKWSSIAWNTGNDALIDAERTFLASGDDDIHAVTVEGVENGTVTVSDSYCVAGDVITVTAAPAPGYKLDCIKVNGTAIEGNSFIAEADTDYVVTAEFAFYRNVTDHGTCGSNLVWTLYENNELAISGTGAMSFSGDSPWYNYRAIIDIIVIDEGVTSIAEDAFYGCSRVKTVTLPDSISRIERFAFQSCSSLSSISLPASLSYVGYDAFSGCNLQSVYFAGTVSDWLRIELYGDTGITETKRLYFDGGLVENLVIPDGTTKIPDYAFQYYEGLRSVSFPDSLQTIGDSAFRGCSSLDHVEFPDSLESIASLAFSGCGLTYAEFFGNAPTLGSNVFGYADESNSIVIYYHNSTSGWSSPKWNGYYAACVEAPADYSALDAENRNAQGVLFTLNETAKTATVGNGSSNSNNAGYYGAQKGAVMIPDVVTKNGTTYRVIGIGPKAFSQNKHVTSVSVGAGVTSIIPSAFMACPALESITVSEDNEFYSASDGILYDIEGLYLYVYPGGKPDASFTVPQTVKTIGQNAFYDNEHLTSLTVGSNVTAIYSGAFCGLTNLGEITLPFIGTRSDSQDDFGTVFGSGYYGSSPIDSRVWNSVKQKYEYGALKRVTISGGELYYNAFSNCSTIEQLALANIPVEIPSRCFSGCASLQKIIFANHTCEIGELVLPEGIESVEDRAFSGCTAITSVTLPASLTYIDSSAFSGSGLERFAVASGNRNYSTDNWGVLYDYTKTALVQYPSCRKWPYYNVAASASSIGYQAFSGCENLVNLYVPNTVTSISGSAIQNCPNLTLCCYIGSAAYNYALNNSLTAWYMNNKTLQGIRIYSLPEQTVQVLGRVNMQGLYVVGNYQGKELQIDDYTVNYDKSSSGVKTVTVEYQGKTVTFDMVLYRSNEGNIISFHCEDDLDGRTVMIAVYNGNGKMLYTGTATISGGEAHIGVSDSVYRNADTAKLFILDEECFNPINDAQLKAVH